MLAGLDVEVRPPKLGLVSYDLPFELGDLPTVVRPLEPQDHLGVAGVDRPGRTVSEIPSDPAEDAPDRFAAGATELRLGEVVENPVGRSPQQRESLQLRQVLLVEVPREVLKLEPIRVELVATPGKLALGQLPPPQALVQLRDLLR